MISFEWSYIITIANFIIILNVVSALSSFVLSFFAFRIKKNKVAFIFGILMSIFGFWGTAKLISFFITSIKLQILIFHFIRGISGLTPMLMIIIISISVRLHKTVMRALFGIVITLAVLLAILKFTESIHHLFMSGYELTKIYDLNILRYIANDISRINLVYLYFCLITAVFLLLYSLIVNPPYFRKQTFFLLIAVFIPALNDVLFRMKISIIPGYHLTPEFFIIGNIFFAVAIFSQKFLKLIPITRNVIVDSLDDIMIAVDGNMEIIDINKSCERLLKVDYNSVTGKKFNDVFGARFTDEIFNGSKKELSLPINNETGFFSVNISTVELKEENQLVQIAFFRDITQKKLYEIKLEEYSRSLKRINKTKDKLFSIISHDLKGPLASQRSFICLILNTINEKNILEVKNYLKLLYSSSDQLFNFIENLLTWALSQKGEIKFIPQTNILNKIIDKNLNLFDQAIHNKKINIINAINKEIVFKFDNDMIDIVLRNLLSNAIKFTNPGGSITLSFEKDSNNVYIKISDTGTGIPEYIKDNIFSDKHILESKTGTAGERGTGLGLALCAEFIAMHSGRIWIDKTEKNAGTGIIFSIPLNLGGNILTFGENTLT